MLGRPVNPFKGRHYSGEIILLAVRWYLRKVPLRSLMRVRCCGDDD